MLAAPLDHEIELFVTQLAGTLRAEIGKAIMLRNQGREYLEEDDKASDTSS